MAAPEDLPPRVETLITQLTEADRDLAADLLRAVTAYTDAELRLTQIDTAAGHGISTDRLDTLGRLELLRFVLRSRLERDLERHDSAR